jgi:hypothetical protein
MVTRGPPNMASTQCKWGSSEQGIIIEQHGVSDVCRFLKSF